jgi:hypothetical protein
MRYRRKRIKHGMTNIPRRIFLRKEIFFSSIKVSIFNTHGSLEYIG